MILDVGPTPIVMTLTVPYVQMEIQAIVYCETQIRQFTTVYAATRHVMVELRKVQATDQHV